LETKKIFIKKCIEKIIGHKCKFAKLSYNDINIFNPYLEFKTYIIGKEDTISFVTFEVVNP